MVGTLKNLGIKVSDTTIDNVRKRHGISLAQRREKNPNWSKFLSAHWDGLFAADFFTTEVLCRTELVTYYTLFVIELKSRLVHVCESTPNPNGEWMQQIARNLTDYEVGFATGASHLIIDRDTKNRKFYDESWNHQEVGNELLTARELADDGPLECQGEVRGILNFYFRKAA